MARTSIEAQRSSSRTKKTAITKAKGPKPAFLPQKFSKQKKEVLTTEESQEMHKLAQLLPHRMQSANRDVDPITLINDATRYINRLTATVIYRVNNGSLPREALLMLRLPAGQTSVHEATSSTSSSPQK